MPHTIDPAFLGELPDWLRDAGIVRPDGHEVV
jgi:hypothetical protein